MISIWNNHKSDTGRDELVIKLSVEPGQAVPEDEVEQLTMALVRWAFDNQRSWCAGAMMDTITGALAAASLGAEMTIRLPLPAREPV